MGEDGIKLMEDYGNMSPEEMSILLFRSMGAFGARGKCVLILLVSLLFAFFLLIPSTSCKYCPKQCYFLTLSNLA